MNLNVSVALALGCCATVWAVACGDDSSNPDTGGNDASMSSNNNGAGGNASDAGSMTTGGEAGSSTVSLDATVGIDVFEECGAEDLVNGGAEEGELAPWEADDDAIVAAMSQGAVTPDDGDYLFSFGSAPEAAAVATLVQVGGISGRPTLTLTGKVNTANTEASEDFAQVLMEALGPQGNVLGNAVTELLQTNGTWQEFTLTVPILKAAAEWRITLNGVEVGGTTLEVFYDSLELSAACE